MGGLNCCISYDTFHIITTCLTLSTHCLNHIAHGTLVTQQFNKPYKDKTSPSSHTPHDLPTTPAQKLRILVPPTQQQ
jgi:hypothetical protein